MKFEALLTITTAFIDRLNGAIGKSVAWLSIIMALIVFFLVLLRSTMDVGSIAAQELVTYLHATLFMLAMAYTLKGDGHIRVDIFFRRMTPIPRAWINILGTILFLIPFALFLIVISWDSTLTSWAIKEGSSNTGGIPAAFLLKTLVPLGGAVLLLQGIAEVLRNLHTLTYSTHRED